MADKAGRKRPRDDADGGAGSSSASIVAGIRPRILQTMDAKPKGVVQRELEEAIGAS
jgi:hypothetical protein